MDKEIKEVKDEISGLPLIDNKLDNNFLERNGSGNSSLNEETINEEEINEKLNDILGIFKNINIEGLEDLKNINDLNNINNKDSLENLNKSLEEISQKIDFNELFSIINKISPELGGLKENMKKEDSKSSGTTGGEDDEDLEEDFMTESERDENDGNESSGIELGENLLEDKLKDRLGNLDINEMLKSLGNMDRKDGNLDMENMTLGNFGSIFQMMNQIFGGGINKKTDKSNTEEENDSDIDSEEELAEYLDKPEEDNISLD